MKRSFSRIVIGEGVVRYKTKLESEQCEFGTHQARVVQSNVLQMITDNPSLVACGPSAFDRLSISHNGNCWVVECEAVAAGNTGEKNG